MSETVETELRTFFESPNFICPFARAAKKAFFSDDRFEGGKWMSTLSAGDVAIIYASGSGLSFEQAAEWCRKGYLLLQFAVVPGPACLGRPPFLMTPSGVFYTIGFGPQYPVEHPRHAPHLCMVSVSEAQIRAVPPAARTPVRCEMARRVGFVYDADYVWMPLKPKSKMDANDGGRGWPTTTF